MSIKIRKAELSDSLFLANMILQSSRADKSSGLFDLIFDADSNDEILSKIEKLVQADVKNHCSYKNFLIAEIDGKNVGSLCSYEPRLATKENFISALNEINVDYTNEILDIYYSCSVNQNRSALVFDFMEEVDGFIDVGILKSLMQKSLLNARLKGYRVAQTIIEIGSLEVELSYKKLGFIKKDEVECEDYKEAFGRTGLMLMSIDF